jgi:hypothetical protein
MSGALPSVRVLARRLLALGERSAAGHDPVEAAHHVLARLADRLSLLVGTGGFHLLLQRALKRALREHPWLVGVQTGVEEPWRLTGVEEAARGANAEDVAAGLESAVAELVGLIARFLGADMAVRLVRQSFPELTASGDPGSGSEETIDE